MNAVDYQLLETGVVREVKINLRNRSARKMDGVNWRDLPLRANPGVAISRLAIERKQTDGPTLEVITYFLGFSSAPGLVGAGQDLAYGEDAGANLVAAFGHTQVDLSPLAWHAGDGLPASR